MPGPLEGVRIVEFAGIGPGPFACMMLADHGAEIIRVERRGSAAPALEGGPETDVLLRSRKRLAIDLKDPAGRAIVERLVRKADGIVEGFRPGVMERLGLGPDALLAINERLVYGRITGWGQTGPLAPRAGHDINYIALSGALHTIGRRGEAPVPPINLLGDFGGGGMLLAFGMLAALLNVRSGGKGQVVDAAMTEGAALLSAMLYTFRHNGRWGDERGTNMLDTGAHFYEVYETADRKHVAVGPIEPAFYAVFLERLGLAGDPQFARQLDPALWGELKGRLRPIFGSKTRDEWDAIFDGYDACYAPVLSMEEASRHPHNRARNAFIEAGGVLQPAPAPRYSLTPCDEPRMASRGSDADAVLTALGYSADDVAAMREQNVVG